MVEVFVEQPLGSPGSAKQKKWKRAQGRGVERNVGRKGVGVKTTSVDIGPWALGDGQPQGGVQFSILVPVRDSLSPRRRPRLAQYVSTICWHNMLAISMKVVLYMLRTSSNYQQVLIGQFMDNQINKRILNRNLIFYDEVLLTNFINET